MLPLLLSLFPLYKAGFFFLRCAHLLAASHTFPIFISSSFFHPSSTKFVTHNLTTLLVPPDESIMSISLLSSSLSSFSNMLFSMFGIISPACVPLPCPQCHRHLWIYACCLSCTVSRIPLLHYSRIDVIHTALRSIPAESSCWMKFISLSSFVQLSFAVILFSNILM